MPLELKKTDALWMPSSILLYGPPKEGKTWAAATWSEHCPEGDLFKRGRSAPKAELSDMLFCMWDGEDGVMGFPGQNLTVPYLDCRPAPAQLPAFLSELKKFIQDRVTSGATKCVVIDTVSAMDAAFNEYGSFKTKCNDANFEKGPSMQRYDIMRANHVDFVNFLERLPCTKIYLCHTKIKDSDMSGKSNAEGKSAVQLARTVDGLDDATVAPAITGQGWNHYMKVVSLILFLDATVRNGTEERRFYTKKQGGVLAGRRVQLDDKEPADFRILKKKLRGEV